MTRLSVMCPKGVLSPNLVENSMDPVDLDLERLISQCDPTVLTDWDLTLMPWV